MSAKKGILWKFSKHIRLNAAQQGGKAIVALLGGERLAPYIIDYLPEGAAGEDPVALAIGVSIALVMAAIEVVWDLAKNNLKWKWL